MQFKETAPHSSLSWHNDPVPQYVLTLAGILEFTTRSGETFTIYPGDVLLATDHTGDCLSPPGVDVQTITGAGEALELEADPQRGAWLAAVKRAIAAAVQRADPAPPGPKP